MRRLERLKVEMLATPDQQISLTDPDARSMATSGRGSGVVGYNVQIAVEANHHLIVMHEVTNDGTDRIATLPCSQGAGRGEARCRRRPRLLLQQRRDSGMRGGRHHGYAAKADGAKAEGRFGTFTLVLLARSSPTTPRPRKTDWCCAATGPTSARAVQSSPLAPPARNDGSPDGNMSTFSKPFSAGSIEHPEKMRQRRETVEHPFGTIKARMGSNPFPDEDAATSCLRDGATRAGLQSDPGHQHHGHSAAHGRDEGLAKPEKRLLNATRPKLLRFDTSGKAFLHNQDHAGAESGRAHRGNLEARGSPHAIEQVLARIAQQLVPRPERLSLRKRKRGLADIIGGAAPAIIAIRTVPGRRQWVRVIAATELDRPCGSSKACGKRWPFSSNRPGQSALRQRR
jgi:hypothetical protein